MAAMSCRRSALAASKFRVKDWVRPRPKFLRISSRLVMMVSPDTPWGAAGAAAGAEVSSSSRSANRLRRGVLSLMRSRRMLRSSSGSRLRSGSRVRSGSALRGGSSYSSRRRRGGSSVPLGTGCRHLVFGLPTEPESAPGFFVPAGFPALGRIVLILPAGLRTAAGTVVIVIVIIIVPAPGRAGRITVVVPVIVIPVLPAACRTAGLLIVLVIPAVVPAGFPALGRIVVILPAGLRTAAETVIIVIVIVIVPAPAGRAV